MKHLKEIRIKHGYTQSDIAKTLGISRAAYTNIENGKREPDFDTLNKLSNVFNVPTDYLLDRNSEGWDSIVLPPEDSAAYDSILVVLLNMAHIFGKPEIESELHETLPSRERLIEIAQMCRYDSASFARLISNCKVPIQKPNIYTNLSEHDLLIASAYHMANDDDKAVVDAALRKYYDCVTGIKEDSEKMA